MAEIIVTIALEVAKCLAPPIERRISCLRNYKSNFESLKTEVGKLMDERKRIQDRVDEARRNVEDIEDNVQKWLETTSNMTNDEAAKKLSEDEETAVKKRCFMGLCPDLKKRYQLSKEAENQKEAIAKHREETGKFDRVSHPIIPKDPRLSNKDFETFESRISTFMDVVSSLSDPDVNIVGIYGMGGIGKTTLAKEVAKQAKEERLFDRVVFAEVSQNPNIMKIQKEIAEKLGLNLSEEESESGRAGKLYQRLKNEQKILVILDNIWTRLDLQAVGIPLANEHKGCKLLLTARSVDVLLRDMDSEHNFSVSVLENEEAWSLFKKMAGDYIEDREFNSVAREVANECAGLPIAVVTVGRALRKRRLYEWEDALQQLRRSSSENIEGAHSTIELSYNHLESDILKKTFLLIGYSCINSIDLLLMYGMGLGLFQGIKKMEEARVRVCRLVQKLKDSCMLFNNDEDLSMHDVVRHVAISIALRDEHVLINLSLDELEWPDENTVKSCSSLVLHKFKTGELPEVPECPQLKLLSIYPCKDSSLKIPEDFFSRMKELRVLNLTETHLWSPPSSLGLLTNLHTLCLLSCQLDDIVAIGDLKKLEILCLAGSDIVQLPVEVGQLTRLRLLDLRHCLLLKVIPPNIISRLSHLEELYMGSFSNWEVEGLNDERRNASLDELKYLSHLTSLEVFIEDVNTLPKDFSFKKLERYKILVGDLFSDWDKTSPLERYRQLIRGFFWDWDKTLPDISRNFKIQVNNANICLNKGHIMQLKGIQDLHLDGLLDMKNVLYGLDREGFPQLKYLHVADNDNILCVVDSMDYPTCNAFPVLESLYLVRLTNLKEICRGQVNAKCFCKLRKIKVENCYKLESMLSFSIAKRLQRLQSIHVFECKNMERIVVIGREDESNNNSAMIELSQLRKLKLNSLPNLTSFCSQQTQGVSTTDTGLNEIILADDINVPAHTLFNDKVALPNLEIMELYGIKVDRIWQNQVVAITCGIQNLTQLMICYCSNIRCLFSSSIANSFIQLQYLEVSECPLLEEIVIVEERKEVVFPQLMYLKMNSLKILTKFCSCNNYIEFPSLKKLEIKGCPELKEFMVKDISTDLTTSNEVSSTEIPSPLFNAKVAFPSLEEILISHMSNLKMLWHHQLAKDSFCKLKSMEVESCNRLRYLFPSSTVSSLVRLQHLSVCNCKVLEEIIAVDNEGSREEEMKNAMFPQLNYLKMKNLENLTKFCSWNHYIEFPSLKRLEIMRCPKLKEFMVKSGKDVSSSEIPSPLFNEKVAFPLLENLVISCMNNLKMLWHHQLVEDSFCKLKSMKVEECNRLSCLFSSSIAKGFIQLQHLEICKCLDLKEIIVVDERKDVVFPQLNYLKMENLGNLKQFCSCEHHIEFPSLKKLEIMECPELKEFMVERGRDVSATKIPSPLFNVKIIECPELKEFMVEKGRDVSATKIPSPLFNEKVAFPSLEEILISGMRKLKMLWHHQLAIDSLCKLKSIKVESCNRLRCLFSSSTVSNLVQLQHLSVCSCLFLEDIIVDDDDGLKEGRTKNAIFPQLNYLKMENLDNLKKFCSCNHYIEFPSLKRLEIMNCYKLKEFMVKRGKDVCSTEIPSPLFNEKVVFPSLEKIVISHMNNLKMLWYHQLAEDSFCKLTSMKVDSCDKLQTIFPWNIYRNFLWLESLSVTSCGSLEVIFDMEGSQSFETTHGAETQLSELSIVGLPKLNYVWNKDPKKFLCFQKLKAVRIDDCARLKNVFPASVARSLSQLEKLYLSECGVEEIVFVSDQEGAETTPEFFFPQALSLILYDLPKLTTFFPAPQPLFKVFPNLKELFVNGKSIPIIWQFPVDVCKIETLVVELDESTDTSTDILSLDFFLRFHNVRKLQIDGGPCANNSRIQEKMSEVGSEGGVLSFLLDVLTYFGSKDLESVIWNLNMCFHLKHILTQESNMDHLVHLRVKGCNNLVNLVPSSTSFQYLTTLEVWDCKELTKIVTSSTAKSLVQLIEMSIIDCYMITEIVTDEGDVAKAHEIVFEKLKKLSLTGLKCLISFCSGNYNFNFPSLEELTVIECPNMNIFSAGELSTPNLHQVNLDEAGWWKGDLNTTIQQLHEQKRMTKIVSSEKEEES